MKIDRVESTGVDSRTRNATRWQEAVASAKQIDRQRRIRNATRVKNETAKQAGPKAKRQNKTGQKANCCLWIGIKSVSVFFIFSDVHLFDLSSVVGFCKTRHIKRNNLFGVVFN